MSSRETAATENTKNKDEVEKCKEKIENLSDYLSDKYKMIDKFRKGALFGFIIFSVLIVVYVGLCVYLMIKSRT